MSKRLNWKKRPVRYYVSESAAPPEGTIPTWNPSYVAERSGPVRYLSPAEYQSLGYKSPKWHKRQRRLRRRQMNGHQFR